MRPVLVAAVGARFFAPFGVAPLTDTSLLAAHRGAPPTKTLPAWGVARLARPEAMRFFGSANGAARARPVFLALFGRSDAPADALIATRESTMLLQAPLLIAALILALIAINIWQNGESDRPAPRLTSLADARALRTKADFVAAWRAAAPPRPDGYAGEVFDAELAPLGVFAPISAFISNSLFGGVGQGPWLGKRFDAGAESGINRFRKAGDLRTFHASVEPSRFDGKPALVLDYSRGDSWLWGRAFGMRDELREVAPGLWLGLGSFSASGGMRNCAPFIMYPKPSSD